MIYPIDGFAPSGA